MIGETKENKKILHPQNGASMGLTILYAFYIVLTVIQILGGCGIIIASAVEGDVEPKLGFLGVSGFVIGGGVIISGLITIIFLQFLNSRIKMTKAAEYYIAKIEQDYTIK